MAEKTDRTLELALQSLVPKAKEGRIALFLGAGINKGSKNLEGDDAPLAQDLAKKIKANFLPDEDLPLDLSTVAEVVEIRESRRLLDRYIYDLLIDYEPSKILKKLPTFKWRRIYTTNFDLLVETAYDLVEAVQKLYVLYSDLDRQDFQLGPEVPYVKLHGCISKISDPDLRLILTKQDYQAYEENRHRLYSRLRDDLFDNTILFMGYSLADANFQNIFYSVQKQLGGIRDFPRCYAVMPNPAPYLVDLWNTRKVTILDMTASDFFDLLEEKVEVAPVDTEIDKTIDLPAEKSISLEVETARQLFSSFEVVTDRLGYDTNPDHENYYQGNRATWEIIRANCDAKRTIYDNIVDDVLFVDPAEKPNSFEFVIITAEAGAGKTTLLMRLAYDHAKDLDGFCLFHKSNKPISVPLLEELYRLIKRRIFLYVDDAADSIVGMSYLARQARSLALPITVVCAERKNEWNAVAERITSTVPIHYELTTLDEEEITNILQVLEKNDYLCDLANKTIDERREVFHQKAEKQLLVAMREATEGRDFDTIIRDEYDHIPDETAKRVYLYTCALHRFGVSVRAGLLHRLSGIPYDEFQEKLLQPLENVITEERNEELFVMLYRARHPIIASIVSKYVLSDGERITNTYLDIISKMDLGYASDYASFTELVRAHELVKSIPGIERKRLYYEQCLKLSGEAAFVYQHFGMMEMDEQNLDEAETYIAKACQLEPDNQTFKHSYARLLSRKSQQAQERGQSLAADKLFSRAQEILADLIRWYPTNSYAYVTYAQNLIRRARQSSPEQKEVHLEEAHLFIVRGLRLCHDKSELHKVDAWLFSELGQPEEAKKALFKAHDLNPSNIRTALLLARMLRKEGDLSAAIDVVKASLRFEPQHETLNYLAAQILMKLEPSSHDAIINYLRKAFDSTYVDADANFYLALEYYKAEQYDSANDIFREFRRRKEFKTSRKTEAYLLREFLIDEHNDKILYSGQVTTLTSKYGFISSDLLADQIYFRNSGDLNQGMRVEYFVGFNLFGPIAVEIQKA